MALLNAVSVGAGQAFERVLDARQVAQADKLIPIAQTSLKGVACSFEPRATLAEFTSLLRYGTHITPTVTDQNPATPWHIEVYAKDLKAYAAETAA